MASTSSPVADLIRRVLGNSFLGLEVTHLQIDDEMGRGPCTVNATLSSGETIRGSGVGPVDALFNGFRDRFSAEYPALLSIRLSRFSVEVHQKTWALSSGMDAEVEVSLNVRNAWGNTFSFSATSSSLMAAAGQSTASVIEHFINAERAFLLLRRCLADARERGRLDLVGKYMSELVDVVKSTSFEKTLERDW